MRKFLSNVLLIVFIFVFAFPVSLLAQNNSWVPPAGPPLQNNTPSPVNVGTQPQTKRGNLTIQGIFEGRGINSFRENPTGTTPSSFTAAFTPFYFLNNVTVGNSSIFPTLDIYGTLKYKPPVTTPDSGSSGGVLGGQLGGDGGGGPAFYTGEPETGYVLTSIDDQGTVSWRPGLPTTGNNGDTLIWNETCNCWTTGTGGANLPPGEAGQTMWFNGETGQWEATNQIEHGDFSGSGVMITNLSNNMVQIPGPSITIGTNNSTIPGIANPGTRIFSKRTIISSNTADSNLTLNSRKIDINSDVPADSLNQSLNVEGSEVNFNTQTAASQSIKINSDNVEFNNPAPTTGDTQQIDVKSATVNFSSTLNGSGTSVLMPQNVNFLSKSVNLIGSPNPGGFPPTMDPGEGRLAYSVSDQGTFKWNKDLVYTNETIGGSPFGVLNILNPNNGFGLLRNNGYTNLLDDVVVGEEGQVFLSGLTSGYLEERNQDLIKPLCYVYTTKRIVNCQDDAITENENEIFTPGLGDPTLDATITYTPDSIQEYHEFTHTGQVEVKYCGGGGGGGGGGLGAPDSENDPFQGGNGGGGGAAAQCDQITLSVTPGDRLYWLIGEGGFGGAGASFNSSSTSNSVIASNGQNGGLTQIYFMESGTQNQNQVGQTVLGGGGGMRGVSVNENTPGYTINVAAPHGNPSLSSGTYGWWFNGGFGRLSNGQFNNPSLGSQAGCNSCGGRGGMGEAYSANGSLRTPDNNPITSYQELSSGGGGGVAQGSTSSSWTNRNGVPGRGAAPSFGGGGGGGSFGQLSWTSINVLQLRGGDGGVGGDGYVRISGLPNYGGSNPDNQFVFETPGTYTLTQTQILNNIPPNITSVTVEVWGAGGGAGGVPGTGGVPTPRLSGGGGGGMYLKRENVPVANLVGATLVVGARGENGFSGGDNSSTTNGGNGGNSQINLSTTPPIVDPNRVANGGFGGERYAGTVGNTPQGGAGATNPIPSLNGWVRTNGGDGMNGANATSVLPACPTRLSSNEGAGQGPQGFGDGSPRSCANFGGDVFEGQAKHGRIRISW